MEDLKNFTPPSEIKHENYSAQLLQHDPIFTRSGVKKGVFAVYERTRDLNFQNRGVTPDLLPQNVTRPTSGDKNSKKSRYMRKDQNPHEYWAVDRFYPPEKSVVGSLHMVPYVGSRLHIVDFSTHSIKLGTKKHPLMVAYDLEWQIQDHGRMILSYQFSVAVEGTTYDFIYVPVSRERKHRLYLNVAIDYIVAFIQNRTGIVLKHKTNADSRESLCEVFLVGHYGIVDLSGFQKNASFDLLTKADAIRGTAVSIEKPLWLRSYDSSRRSPLRPHTTYKVTLRDTMLLASAGSSLDSLGRALGLPKIELSAGFEKGNMLDVFNRDLNLFFAYALNDSSLTLEWGMTVANGENLPLPVTTGSEAAVAAKDIIKGTRSFSSNKEFDLKWRGLNTYTKTDSKGRKTNYTELSDTALDLVNTASACYHGGRNECFAVGIFELPEYMEFSDFDIAGAYSVAMAATPDIDFSKPPTTLSGNLDNIKPTDIGFGFIQFEFPESTRFPCLPVKDPEGRGLIFPLKGETWACAPEIYLAIRMGAKVTSNAFKMAIKTENYSLLEVMLNLVNLRTQARLTHGKGSAQELLAKERVNSVYGKLAQGLQDKRNYSPRKQGMVNTAPSQITNAPLAAHCTSLVRAFVSAAIDELARNGFNIYSVTTDGFLTEADPGMLNMLACHGFADMFKHYRKLTTGSDVIWEVKHTCEKLIMIKTRGGVGYSTNDKDVPPLAKAGFKMRQGAGTHKEMCEDFASIYLSRNGRVAMSFEKAPGVRQYIENDADAIFKTVNKSLWLEYDFKRCPIQPKDETVCIAGTYYTHVTYYTKPHATWEDFNIMRKQAEGGLYKEKAQMLLLDDKLKKHNAAMKTPAGMDADRVVFTSIIRSIRNGKISFAKTLFSDKNPTGTEIMAYVVKALNLKVTFTRFDWSNAAKEDRRASIDLSSRRKELALNGLILEEDSAALELF